MYHELKRKLGFALIKSQNEGKFPVDLGLKAGFGGSMKQRKDAAVRKRETDSPKG